MSHHAPRINDLHFTRRDFLTRCGMGMGGLSLGSLLGNALELRASESASLHPLAPKQPPLPAKAKRVIHLFMNGGPSHVDTFDPKPELTKYHGKEIPIHLNTERKTGAAFGSPFAFNKYGKAGSR